MAASGFLNELKRRNVLRAAVLYAGATWALAQGFAQLAPVVGAPDWAVRWFLVAAVVGFPFWIAFAWFYEFTPGGLKHESEIDPADSVAHRTGRKLDFWIIGVLTAAVVLLVTDRFVLHKGGDAAAIPAKSIAVLPLANGSDDKDQVYFSDGLSEDLINALSQFAGLKVIGRNSSFQFRDSRENAQTIGNKLGVAHLLEGSVRHAGDTVRITAQLINSADGSTLWSEHYDRPFKDLFALQDEITHAVANALKARLLSGAKMAAQSDRPPSGNLAAYTAVLQGRQYGRVATGEDDWIKAIETFSTATRLDPDYALAYANQAIGWVNVSSLRTGAAQQQALLRARSAVNIALKVGPENGAAHSALAIVHQYADHDWAAAEAEYRRAVQLNPSSAASKLNLSSLLLTLDRPEQAFDLLRQSLAIDPLQPLTHINIANTLTMLGRFDEAEQAARKLAELQPARAPQSHSLLAMIEILRGNAKAALAQARQSSEAMSAREVNVALALQIGADRAAADAALKALIAKPASDQMYYPIAEVYALRKDANQVFVWLDRAVKNDEPVGETMLSDPLFKPYQHDPRFSALARQLGLPVVAKTLSTAAPPAGNPS